MERKPSWQQARAAGPQGDAAAVPSRIETAVRAFIAKAILFNHQVAHRLGLGASDGQFMYLLQVHGPLTPGRLAELSGLTTGTVTGVIDRLESAGFVRRERDPSDRRKVLVTLEEQHLGHRLAPLYAGQAESLARVAGSFDAEQRDLIADFLEQLVADSPSSLPD